MRIEYIFFNLAVASILFCLNGWLGKLQYGMEELSFEYGRISFFDSISQNFSGNFFQKIINPTVYLAAIAAITQGICPRNMVESLWLMIPLFWVIRLLYMILKNRLRILNLKFEAVACLLSLSLGECVFWGLLKNLIEQEEPIWISSTALRDAVWFAILAYLAKVVWNILKRSYSGERLYPQDVLDAYVLKRYDVFSKKYGAYISKQVAERYGEKLNADAQEKLIRIIYAIMIYEDYNRPYLTRILEQVMKVTIKRQRMMTLGVMQAKTKNLISDHESIEIAMEEISRPFLSGDAYPEEQAARAYNQGENYAEEVMAIYNMLDQHIPFGSDAPDNASYKI